jgi:hypothetical protein
MAKKTIIWKDAFVAALKATEKERDIYEDQGFGVRIRVSGTLTWIYSYTFAGTRKLLVLGNYRKGNQKAVVVSLGEARKRRADPEHGGGHVTQRGPGAASVGRDDNHPGKEQPVVLPVQEFLHQ